MNVQSLITAGSLQKPIDRIRCASACHFIHKIMALDLAGSPITGRIPRLKISGLMDNIASRALLFLKLKQRQDALQLIILSIIVRGLLHLIPVIPQTIKKNVNYFSTSQIMNLAKMLCKAKCKHLADAPLMVTIPTQVKMAVFAAQ